ncbi:uncharacterized protein DUF1648 [Lachnotalea glycerini]|uniref:DUF1648 domain-containing protein n=1 Tax=Lachnotalea glycerini TaxID=1763509 RepID=A0A255IXC6_9FIRM|nr:DUF1648 domain-containing protein [Lachnotalea glycerini]OYO43054.1 DUF1648 domain-containing protein [Lachnotalea glycerini]PXV86668.1 uncharacterized protein DUF1648 [Lachnotalea glycerini]RDY32171.1 DUF1648 domain-containing protein [Lachnotalea glycerini]
MNINKTRYDIFVNIVGAGILIAMVLYLWLNWQEIPESIPAHYNAAGVIDRWGNKKEIFIEVIIAWILYIGITVLERFPQIWNTGVTVTEQNKVRVYRILKNLIETQKLLIAAIFSYSALNSALSRSMSVWFLPIVLVLMFGSIAFFTVQLIKVK